MSEPITPPGAAPRPRFSCPLLGEWMETGSLFVNAPIPNPPGADALGLAGGTEGTLERGGLANQGGVCRDWVAA